MEKPKDWMLSQNPVTLVGSVSSYPALTFWSQWKVIFHLTLYSVPLSQACLSVCPSFCLIYHRLSLACAPCLTRTSARGPLSSELLSWAVDQRPRSLTGGHHLCVEHRPPAAPWSSAQWTHFTPEYIPKAGQT